MQVCARVPSVIIDNPAPTGIVASRWSDVARVLRICQVSAAYYPYPSGVTELVHHLTLALRARGHHVEILTTAYPRMDRAMGLESGLDVGVTRIGRAVMIPMNKSYATMPFAWSMSKRVKGFLRRSSFDILHLHGFFPPDISFYALHHSQVTNVVSFLTVGFKNYRFAAGLFPGLYRKYIRKMHGRIALTQGALQYIQPYFPGEFRVIPPGVDTGRFRPLNRDLRFPLLSDTSADSRTVLFVGRLDERKGLAVLLRAMPRVLAQVPGTRLIVVGKGPQEDESRHLARELGLADVVTFQGFVANDELPAFYASADVYCSPALGGEAFGIVLIEAMACGTPVVASDITGYNEVVRSGVNGLLCPPANPPALADALIRMLNDAELRAKCRTAGLAQAQAHSWVRIAEQVENYYLELLTTRSSPFPAPHSPP